MHEVDRKLIEKTDRWRASIVAVAAAAGGWDQLYALCTLNSFLQIDLDKIWKIQELRDWTLSHDNNLEAVRHKH